ncbi:PREDICTED: odorant receptor 46a, isoform A-like [Dinoponera quadriceps]|uniref:Odorant receptor 46a, isoform A-like n=1 Tax=Dinoponera quadriceps TaxID=609295 RepID=A0A6P3Y8V9_DINQU|nr:PREDICTED: odorant receptor 46a, isoform A-like [Dinoponera quadriceps]
MNVALNVGNSEVFANTIYMMLTVFVAFYKIIIMWLNCKNITGIVTALTKGSFAPAELGEIMIRRRYANMVNDQFLKIIALQFGVSTLVVCSNLFQLAMAAVDANILPLILYTACMLSQIFIYCWFGNEVKIKSLQVTDNVYKIKWLALDNRIKKGLLLIMKRSASPIEFTSAVVITMNLDSFVSVLKASYSVFNLLKRANE